MCVYPHNWISVRLAFRRREGMGGQFSKFQVGLMRGTAEFFQVCVHACTRAHAPAHTHTRTQTHTPKHTHTHTEPSWSDAWYDWVFPDMYSIFIYYSNSSHLATTGWRRPLGCLKLQVIFRKRATDNRALLRKMTYKDKASYDSTPL